jgi:3-methyladenine DNA glycosylase AlkD
MTATPNRAGSAGPTDGRAWADEVVRRTDAAFADQGDATRAEGAERYMKHVAPFLGIDTPERRRLLRAAWRGLPTPTSDDLGRAAAALMARREREYHYAAYDLLAQFIDAANEQFLRRWVTQLLTTTPWWDTVDGIGTAAVSPLGRRFDSAATIDEWSESGNRWLVRAAIQHQRGWRRSTDVERVLGLCHRHWAEREFFIAKAIGWALRDITRLDPEAVRRFLADHRGNAVAEREATRGLTRAARGSTRSPERAPQER